MAQSGLRDKDLAARHVVRDNRQVHAKYDHVTTDGVSQGKVTKAESSGNQDTGILVYRLQGVLVLLSLYSTQLSESRVFKTQLMQLKKTCSYLREELKRCKESLMGSLSDTEASVSSRSVDEENDYRGESDLFGDSLLSSMLKAMQLELSKLKAMISGIEGKTAEGLIKENHELRLLCQHQRSTIDSLQQEANMYHQLKSSMSLKSSKQVQQTLDYDHAQYFQQTLVKELGMKLNEQSVELNYLRQRLDAEYYGRQRMVTCLSDLLNELVLRCLQMPYVAMEAELKQAFIDIQKKTEKLSVEFRDEVLVAIQLASDVSARSDFLRAQMDVTMYSEEELAGMSDEAVRVKVTELQKKLSQLMHQAKNKVIEQMKKYKQATLRVKDLEERLNKVETDKSLVELQLSEEIRQTQAKFDALHMSLGNRSSYADKAAQSARTLVELLEHQKSEMESQLMKLHKELAFVSESLHETHKKNLSLEDKIEDIQRRAEDEAKASVKVDLDRLQSELSRLQSERARLTEQVDVLGDIAKEGHKARQLAEDKVHTLEDRAKAYELEIKDYKVRNAELMKLNVQLEAKMRNLETDKLKIVSRMRGIGLSRDGTSNDLVLAADVADSGVVYHRVESPSRTLVEQSLEGVSHTRSGRNEQQIVAGADFQSPSQTAYGSLMRSDVLHQTPTDGNQSSSVECLPQADRLSSLMSYSLPQTLLRDEAGSVLYSRSLGSQMGSMSKRIETMHCIRCNARFSVSNLDDYERHLRECYPDIQ